MTIIRAVDILGPPPPDSLVLKELVIVGGLRHSKRGKLAETAKVQKAINLLMDQSHHTNDLEHERLHIEADVEGEQMQPVGAYRESTSDGKVLNRESVVRLLTFEGNRRSRQDLIRIASAPGVHMSEGDKMTVRNLGGKP